MHGAPHFYDFARVGNCSADPGWPEANVGYAARSWIDRVHTCGYR